MRYVGYLSSDGAVWLSLLAVSLMEFQQNVILTPHLVKVSLKPIQLDNTYSKKHSKHNAQEKSRVFLKHLGLGDWQTVVYLPHGMASNNITTFRDRFH